MRWWPGTELHHVQLERFDEMMMLLLSKIWPAKAKRVKSTDCSAMNYSWLICGFILFTCRKLTTLVFSDVHKSVIIKILFLSLALIEHFQRKQQVKEGRLQTIFQKPMNVCTKMHWMCRFNQLFITWRQLQFLPASLYYFMYINADVSLPITQMICADVSQ